MPYVGDNLVLIAENIDIENPDYISSFQVTGLNVDTITLCEEDIGQWGYSIGSLGNARIVGEEANDLTVFGIGPGGEDGISITQPFPTGGNVGLVAEWEPLDTGGELPESTTVVLSSLMRGGETTYIQIMKIPSSWEVSGDFTDIGSSSYTVNLYLDDSIVSTTPGVSGPAAVADLPPDGYVMEVVDDIPETRFTWTTATTISVPSKGMNSFQADAVELIPESPTVPFDSFAETQITGSEIFEITFTKMATSLDCCDTPGDANNDGDSNVGDAVYLIAYVFSGGPPPSCMNEGDANFDCDVNVGDAVYLIGYVFNGGPAPQCGCAE
jgi:hypothetical protein